MNLEEALRLSDEELQAEIVLTEVSLKVVQEMLIAAQARLDQLEAECR